MTKPRHKPAIFFLTFVGWGFTLSLFQNQNLKLVLIQRMKNHPFRLINLLLFSVALLLACGAGSDPRQVSDDFCYRYFIKLDQAQALEIASGLAADKLKKEIELLKGGARNFQDGEREFHQAKPFIDYKMIQRTDQDADHVMFLYHLRIEARQGNEQMQREILVSTIREKGRWKVNNYEDYR